MTCSKKNVSVIGLGYIGLPTAALLASKGYKVNGTDITQSTVETINRGEVHIVEAGLDAYVRSAVINNKLKAYLEVQPADIYMICVPTPFHDDIETPTPNTDYVRKAAENISRVVKDDDIVILESTSPVGSTHMVRDVLQSNGVDTSKIFIAYCPERVLPGKIMKELVENARVIGGIDIASADVAAEFYRTFVNGEILITDAKTAEMCKLTENSFRDVNIAFANELSILCDNNGVNVWDLIELANHHPRVDILQPGTGVGGHCIAVDPWFIAAMDPENAKVIRTARSVNDAKPHWVVKKIKAEADLKKTNKVACLGLAFKPDIDDLRESPAVKVVDMLLDDGFEVSCVEPNIDSHDKYELIDIKQAMSEFDVVVMLVNHKDFSLSELRDSHQSKEILNFCGK